MAKFYEVEEIKRNAAAHLFSNHKHDTVLMNSVLDGHSGRMLVDSLTSPGIARLDTGAFTIFAGDADCKRVVDLIKYAPVYFVTPENKHWSNALASVFRHKIISLPFVEYNLTSADTNKLSEIIKSLPSGYEIRRLDKDLCEQLTEDIPNDYYFENYTSIDDFLNRGIGFCILLHGKIVSAATSMASSRNAIDVEIETKDIYKNKGLGTVIGAKLVLYCIQNSIVPKWLAANKDSERLAKRLGFSKDSCYETYKIVD